MIEQILSDGKVIFQETDTTVALFSINTQKVNQTVLHFMSLTRRSNLPFKFITFYVNKPDYLLVLVFTSCMIFILIIIAVLLVRKCRKIQADIQMRRRIDIMRVAESNLRNNEQGLLHLGNGNLQNYNCTIEYSDPEELIRKVCENNVKQIEFCSNLKVTATTCTICLEDFVLLEKIMLTCCQHAFHPKCIAKWVELHFIKPYCPNCTKKLYGNAEEGVIPSENNAVVNENNIISNVGINNEIDNNRNELNTEVVERMIGC